MCNLYTDIECLLQRVDSFSLAEQATLTTLFQLRLLNTLGYLEVREELLPVLSPTTTLDAYLAYDSSLDSAITAVTEVAVRASHL